MLCIVFKYNMCVYCICIINQKTVFTCVFYDKIYDFPLYRYVDDTCPFQIVSDTHDGEIA